ncbi:MAG: hypothetical protein AAF715_22780 [Myxococcota bacterium]
MTYRRVLGLVALVATCGWAACSVETVRSDDDDDDGDVVPGPNLVGAADVRIREVAMYQGIKRTLAVNGVTAASEVPLVAGRDAMVRVFYDTSRAGASVVGRLELADGTSIDASPAVLAASSTDASLETTVNFIVPGESIGDTFDYRVAILEEGVDENDNPEAYYPAQGLESHAVEGPQNTLRVVMAPFQYNADGSGRVPDMSEEALAVYRERLLQLYPVSNVEVSARAPIPWSGTIAPNGGGWQEVAIETFGLRSQDGESADVYYYGIFNPAATFPQFCGGGCLLGVTLLNSDPPDVGNPQLRVALGVGFDEVGADTCAHELGHSHGRLHADCGPGLAPDSIDRDFPHPGGAIGAWGYDIVNEILVPPSATDIMGYCDNTWISDYNYAALLNRGRNVNAPDGLVDDGYGHQLLAIDGEGNVTAWTDAGDVEALRLGGHNVTAAIFTESGPTERAGTFFSYDHLPGGWLIVPKTDRPTTRIEAVVEGRQIIAER